MACYIVIFELKDSSELPTFKDALKSFSGYCPLTPHSWAIITDQKAAEIRDKLASSINAGSRVFVIRSGTEGAWRNSYGEKHNEWLKKYL